MTYREITSVECCTFAVGKSETPRVVRNTPKEIQISPKVNKIINAKKTRKIMIELNLTLNTNDAIEGVKGKYYPRVEYKESISMAKLAKHMHEHNTVYSKGVIIGVLSDMVSCIKELCLDGNVVKIDDLGLFKATVEGNGLTLKSGAKISAGVGAQRTDEELQADITKQQMAISAVKIIMQATGETTMSEMTRDSSTTFTSKTKQLIKSLTGNEVNENENQNGSNENTGGSQNQGGGENTGGDNGGGSAGFETGN